MAVSDWMKATPVQVADWTHGRFAVLGTDGFGRSDTRERLRGLHEIDAECIAVTVLAQRAAMGEIETDVVTKAIEQYGIDTEQWP